MEKRRKISGLVFSDRTKKVIDGEEENEFNLEIGKQTAIYQNAFGVELELPGIEMKSLEETGHDAATMELEDRLNDMTEASVANADIMEEGDSIPVTQNTEQNDENNNKNGNINHDVNAQTLMRHSDPVDIDNTQDNIMMEIIAYQNIEINEETPMKN